VIIRVRVVTGIVSAAVVFATEVLPLELRVPEVIGMTWAVARKASG